MLKNYFAIFIILTSINVYSSESPDEAKIYYHIHQATRWAELHHSKKVLFSKQEMEKHLGKIKYSEIKLVNSKFYSEYLHLNKLSRNLENSSYVEIEKFRERIHAKAEQFKIQHPKNWQNEFILVQQFKYLNSGQTSLIKDYINATRQSNFNIVSIAIIYGDFYEII